MPSFTSNKAVKLVSDSLFLLYYLQLYSHPVIRSGIVRKLPSGVW